MFNILSQQGNVTQNYFEILCYTSQNGLINKTHDYADYDVI